MSNERADILLPEEQEAQRFLKELELEVHRVPTTSTSRTPDFLLDGDARGYVLEVKARDDSKQWTRAMRAGRAAHQKRSMGYSTWAKDIAHNAVQQFRSVDAQHLRWWVLWLAIKCHASADAMVDEAIGSLFGVRQIVYHDPRSAGAVSGNCLFARRGVFERYPEIVATVVRSVSGFCFCVNDEFARDFASFRESVLWSFFASAHPPTTAADLTENRGFFRADLSVGNRKDDSAVVASLERAYGLENAFMLDMKVHSASMVVPCAEPLSIR
jgi:hypothetical protein